VVNFLDRSSLSIANSTIRSEMHLDGTEMGLLLSAFSLAYGFAQLPLIGLLDRAGTRIILGAGLAIWSTAQMLTGLVRAFSAFLALRVLLGIGEAPFYPSGVRSVREWFPVDGRGRATAVMSMSQTIGLAIAPPALTRLMLRIGWRAMFITLGAAGIFMAVAWITLHRPRGATTFSEKQENEAYEGAWKALIRQRAVWGMMLGSAASTIRIGSIQRGSLDTFRASGICPCRRAAGSRPSRFLREPVACFQAGYCPTGSSVQGSG
jgi:MFS transporter, ACS family, L-galactonate transporter